MSKAIRLSEKWFQRGLWLIAFVFAWFLIGFGGTLIGDLPQVESTLSLDDFVDRETLHALEERIEAEHLRQQQAEDAQAQAQLALRVAEADYQAAAAAFEDWLQTRQATQRDSHDDDLEQRTAQLETLKQAERAAQRAVQVHQQTQLDAQQAQRQASDEMLELRRAASGRYERAHFMQELRVFLYRLALTLPLLLLATWLFVRHRHGRWWPFVWGFVFFALFAFFVELVPYLPSYGGYVRYAVGIVFTVLAGRYAIGALQRYLDRQRQIENQPDSQRRQTIAYEQALARLAKGVCPGCERPVSLADPGTSFCPHCGLSLFDHCANCQTRKSAFSRYCPACGTPSTAMTEEATG